MDHRADPFARWARAGVLAAVVVLVGSLAHASAGGLLPGAASMLALLAAVAAGCALLLGRVASAPLLVTLTVAGQLVVHGALSAMAGHQPPASHGAMSDLHHAADAPAAPGWAVHALQDLVERPGMAAAHLAASALVGLWLALGERALWSLVALARCGARRALRHAVAALWVVASLVHVVRRAVVVRRSRDEPLPQLPLWSRGPARRGPPAVQPTR